MTENSTRKNTTQLIWGATLVIMGIAVFFRIPQVIPKLADMGQSAMTLGFIRVCFYLMGIILIGGGARKIITFVRPAGDGNQQKASGPDEHGSGR